MRSVIYARVSTEEQARKGLSIPAQVEACRKYAAEKGLTVLKVFQDEGESALSANRPEFLEMIAYCQGGGEVKAVIVYDTSRFARNRRDAVLYKRDLEKRGIRVHYASQHISDDEEGRFMEGILEVIDEHYSRMLARVVKRGLIASAKKGNWIGGVPFGYRVEKTEGRRKLEVEPQEAQVVREVFDLFEQGFGCRTIAEKLNDKGCRGRHGKPLSAKGIHDWLTKPIFCGDTVFNRTGRILGRRIFKGPEDWVVVRDTHEALIDRDRFARIQEELKRRGAERHPGRLKSYRRFAGLIECSGCGKTAQAETGTGRHGKLYYYYACRTFRMNSKNLCPGFRVRVDDVEDRLVDLIQTRVFSDGNISGFADWVKERLGEISGDRRREKIRIQRKLEGIRRKLRQVILLAEDELIDPQEAGRRTKELQQERGELEARYAALEEGLTFKDVAMSRAVLEAARRQLKELVGQAEPRVQREFFRKFVRRIRTDGRRFELVYNFGPLMAGPGVRDCITGGRGGGI